MEVSSFMAYSLYSFRPHYSIFTNFKADHLNWHKDLQDYLDSKMRVIESAQKGSVVNAQILEFAKQNHLKIRIPENVRIFGERKKKSEEGKIRKDVVIGDDIIIS